MKDTKQSSSANQLGYEKGLPLKNIQISHVMLKVLALGEGYSYESKDYIDFVNGVIRGSASSIKK